MDFKLLAQNASLWIYILYLAIGIGATVYQMLVIVPTWNSWLPELIRSPIQPANFWRNPIINLGLLVGFATVILHWGTARQNWLLASMGLVLIGFAVTVAWFWPGLRDLGLMEGGQPLTDPVSIAKLIKDWTLADKFRFALTLVPAFLCALKALATPV